MGVSESFAQISPGDLTQAHAELEGMRNCTQCHDLGYKVTNKKCLACHDDIQSLMDQNRGYHASSPVRRQDCFDCHSEHHGRRFDMLRFDQENFNHNHTGYELEGKHEQIDCRACHKADYIADREISSREGTFLGLEQECLSCHEDYHQQTLSADCLSCHDFEAFSPAPGFDHDDSDFPLKGKHETVDCKACHPVDLRNGREFQAFTEIASNACNDCHDDPHLEQIPGTCTQCHDENTFNRFLGQRRFNHKSTGFTLRGAHRQESCFSCHEQTRDARQIFQDQKGIAENSCISCHEDVHEGKYGEDCANCHMEESFLSLKNMDFFDHSVTDYPLEGLHQGVDCSACHIERFSTPIDFSHCKNCHEDYHEGEFTQIGHQQDCIECHSLEQDFTWSSYSINEHQLSQFPLDGAHVATPCFACHISEEEKWHFRNIGNECVDCHEDIHQGLISEKYYPDQTCTSCHGNESWATISFDHDLTAWPLDGKHLDIECRSCHFQESKDKLSYSQHFSDLSADCISCHENVHGDEFAFEGITDCMRCHVTSSWTPEKFDHNLAQFPLEGRHAEVDCRACHEIPEPGGSASMVYKIEKFACIDCHN